MSIVDVGAIQIGWWLRPVRWFGEHDDFAGGIAKLAEGVHPFREAFPAAVAQGGVEVVPDGAQRRSRRPTGGEQGFDPVLSPDDSGRFFDLALVSLLDSDRARAPATPLAGKRIVPAIAEQPSSICSAASSSSRRWDPT
ncbi:hypothetical protein PHK61_31250 [Actinomycetospora lutea]|uniref:hypothetical protein n=1 Tax=Actinomycetospora lutea TaxID=663604 RepID=UPI002365A0EA|nr:hypothetical protein [Actinomycetospora lutea]MDD7942897.1 hypothetical protein [Actinomycetospora lutea]